MSSCFIPILIVLLVSAVVVFFDLHKSLQFWDLINRFTLADLVSRLKSAHYVGLSKLADLIDRLKFLVLRTTSPIQSKKLSALPDLRTLNCRVQLTKQKWRNSVSDAFNVAICGSIHAPSEMHYVTLRISIMDVTNGPHRAKPVQSRVKHWSTLDEPASDESMFCYRADLGKLPNQITTLSDWTAVARLNTDWLIFPRKGKRNLQFSTSVLSRQNGKELACAKYNLAYRNSEFGYMDVEENIQHTKTLTVALAFAVSAADRKLYDCEIGLIKKWARSNFDYLQASDRARRRFERALDKTVDFFRNGNQLNIYAICKEIAGIAPVAFRYDILDLCLRVAQANGFVAADELVILKNLADWLEVDLDRFRAMMEKTVPIRLHQVRDVEVTLGITADMSMEKTRRQLNKEYGKWNSRATSSDPEIRAQADQMLKLIAEARCEYIG